MKITINLNLSDYNFIRYLLNEIKFETQLTKKV